MPDQLLGNRYLILETLGSGGFGETYKALDQLMPSPLICVIKKLTPPSSDEQIMRLCRQLFEREAKTLQILGEHQQIPRLLAYFEQEKEFYLVQEYIEGKTLSQEFSEKRQYSETETIEFLQNVLETLLFVHQKGVIHRDIKPANLIRRYSDKKVVLIDFGAVKQTTTQMINTQGQATQSVVIGTPGYMSSEQSQGYPTYASDIFALGMVGIQALTGRLPQEWERDGHQELIWLSEPDFKVSSKLGAILTKMVRFSTRDRYSSVSEVLDDLQKISSFKTTPSPPPIPPQKNTKLLAGLGLAAVVTIGGWGIYQLTHNSPAIEFGLYQSDRLGISMEYPTKPNLWIVDENLLTNEISFQNPQTLDKVEVTIEPLNSPNYSLDEYTIDQTRVIRSNQSVDNLSVTNTKLGNYEARQINYSIENKGEALEVQDTIVLVKDKAYNLISTTESKGNSSQVAKEMIDSFEVISNPAK